MIDQESGAFKKHFASQDTMFGQEKREFEKNQ